MHSTAKQRRNTRALGAAFASAAMLLGGLAACSKTETAATLVAEARQFQQKGDSKAALIQLKNAAQQSPEDIEVRLLLAGLYVDSGDAASADKEIRKAASLGLAKERALPLLAKVYLMQGKYQRLLDDSAAAPADAGLLSMRGQAYLGLNQLAEARQAFELVLQTRPDQVEALTGLARCAALQRDFERATHYAGLAVERNPGKAEAWLFKGDLERAQDRSEAALASYDRVLKLSPKHAQAHLQKAYLRIGARNYDAAQADIAAARAAEPNNLSVSYAQALLDFSAGRHPAALESLQRVLRAAPEHLPTVLLAGAVQLALGSLPQAEQHLKKYVETVPGNLYARKLLATTLLNAARPKEALAVLAPMLKNSDDVQLLALAGKSHSGMREYAKATEYFEKASAIDPKAAGVRTSLGLSRMAQGERERGMAELEAAATLDASSIESGVVLAMTALRLKQYDKALAAALALEKVEPNNPLLQSLKGGAYLGQGDRVKARASFERSLALQASYFPAVSSLAQLDLQDQQPEAAQRRLEAFLAQDKKHVPAMNALAALAASQGRQEQVTLWLERAQSENAELVAPAVALAEHYLRSGQQPKALTLVRKAQLAHAADVDLLDMLGRAQLANEQPEAALETYSKLAALAPKMAAVQLRVASAYMALKNNTAAEDALRKALVLQPDLLPAHLGLAQAALRRGQPEAALATARLLQKQGANAAAGFALEGDILIEQKKAAPALAAYERAFGLSGSPALLVKLHALQRRSGAAPAVTAASDARLATWQQEHPQDMMVALYLAETLLSDNKLKPAIAQLQQIVQKAPNHAAALNNLAWAYQQAGDARALPTAEHALKQAADHPAILDTVGWILVSQGQAERGVALLAKAAARSPAAEIRYHYAYGLFKTGDKAGARLELEKVLAASPAPATGEEARALLKRL